MKNEYHAISMVSSTPNSDFLAHYGVLGMKWGVRKAIIKGNSKALDRHFRRATKKLAKLQDIGLNSGKYAAKAAAYGTAAVGTGTIAIGGTKMLSNVMRNKAAKLLQKARYAEGMANVGSTISANTAFKTEAGKKLAKQAEEAAKKGSAIDTWGEGGRKIYQQMTENRDPKTGAVTSYTVKNVQGKIDNNARVRIGAAAATVGLGTMAAINGYRAANPMKYRQKAMEFKNEMDSAFEGTKYAGKYVVPPKKRKKK